MISANEEILSSLLSMGVDPEKSREAAIRYSSVDAAVNWVFGAGEDWTPPPADPSPPPSYPIRSNNPFLIDNHSSTGTAEHHEVSRTFTHPPAHPSTRVNRPSLQYIPVFPDLPQPNLPPRQPTISDSDSDEELRRAIELSKGGTSRPPSEIDGERMDRERSLRAEAPPPSPTRPGDESVGNNNVISTLFGPSERNDVNGKLAMVPAGQKSKEEEDFERAIQESLMTASFHSTASSSNKWPAVDIREEGAPVVYLSNSQTTFAAHFIQAIAAVPQLREVFAAVEDSSSSELTILRDLLAKQSSIENYVAVEKSIEAIHDAWNVLITRPLPPQGYLTDNWFPNFVDILVETAKAHGEPLIDAPDACAEFYRDPERLLVTRLHLQPDVPRCHVTFDRVQDSPSDLSSSLSAEIWSDDAPGESIDSLADVVFVILRRITDVPVVKWTLDEHVTLDRYLQSNMARVAQMRAQQALARGELRRLNEQIDVLSQYQGNDIPAALQVLIKHLTTSSSRDDIQTATRAELTAKLEHIVKSIDCKIANLRDQIKANEKDANGGVFDIDDPALKQHNYSLRAVLWHDGFTTPGTHLYAYVRNEDDWWKVQEQEAIKVGWQDIQNDSTGHYTDGGPYLLVYSRIGPRPSAPQRDIAPTPPLSDLDAGETVIGDETVISDETWIGDETLISNDISIGDETLIGNEISIGDETTVTIADVATETATASSSSYMILTEDINSNSTGASAQTSSPPVSLRGEAIDIESKSDALPRVEKSGEDYAFGDRRERDKGDSVLVEIDGDGDTIMS